MFYLLLSRRIPCLHQLNPPFILKTLRLWLILCQYYPLLSIATLPCIFLIILPHSLLAVIINPVIKINLLLRFIALVRALWWVIKVAIFNSRILSRISGWKHFGIQTCSQPLNFGKNSLVFQRGEKYSQHLSFLPLYPRFHTSLAALFFILFLTTRFEFKYF